MQEPDATPLPAIQALGRVWDQRDREGTIEVSLRCNDSEASGAPYRLTLRLEPCR